MWKKLLQWMRTTVDIEHEGDDTQREERGVAEPVGLYECPDCGTVYIRDDPQPCSHCDSTVENVPNERDLGLKTNEL